MQEILIPRAIQIFVLLGPWVAGTIAVFLVSHMDLAKARLIILREILIASIICVLFSHFGISAMGAFGVSQASMKLGGGILLMLTGLSLIDGSSLCEKSAVKSNRDPFLVPLAHPLLAGPCTLFTIINMPQNELFITDMAILIACGASVLFIFLIIGNAKKLPENIMIACNKFSGLFLVAIASQMFLSGFWGFQV